MKNEITYNIELTDLFQGEANYSWVRRATIEAPAKKDERQQGHEKEYVAILHR